MALSLLSSGLGGSNRGGGTGGGGGGGGGQAQGTQPGTYTITVTGTSGTPTHQASAITPVGNWYCELVKMPKNGPFQNAYTSHRRP
jgi:hypothetical protein